MIVGCLYRGDDDKDIMMLQHEVYGQALGIISGTCQEHTNLALRILGDRWAEWEFISNFDHRTLQFAHDTIAAAWRFRCLLSVRQLNLPLDSWQVNVPDFQVQWLQWLKGEIESWKEEPRLIQLVVLILRNQNTPVGYRAEADLNRELIFRYEDVPWNPRILDIAQN